MAKLFMVVNEDRFFLSHRLPIAISARQKGYDVTIIAKDTGHSKEIENLGFGMIGLPIIPTGMNPYQEFKTFRFLFNLYRKQRPDIVHHIGLKSILWGGLAAKLVNVNGVINAVSGLGGLFNGDKLTMNTRMILAVMGFSNRRGNVKVIFQNNDDMSIFLTNNVVDYNQIEYIKGSGIDLEEYAYINEPQCDRINVIFTARMVREKGVCDLIETAEKLKDEYKDKVKFLLCGRLTPNKTGITERYMLEHCDGEYICWLGERNDIKRLLENSHIMVFPSYYREGVPKSLIEASAIGRPIITCDSVGCRDVVDNGVNGFLVNPRNPLALSDCLRVLIGDATLRKRMGIAARKKAEKEFSIHNVIDSHLNIYQTLCHDA